MNTSQRKMKESGVEWVGEIPTHWTVKAIKRDTKVRRGASPRPIDNPIYFDDGGEYAWVRIADVSASEGTLYTTKQQLSALGASLSVKMEPGDLFLSIAGTVGKPCITQIKCCIHDGFVYFPDLSLNRRLLYYIFEAGEAYKGLGKLGTQLNLNTDTVGWIEIPVPPSTEQASVVAYLDRKTTAIDTLIAKKERLLELLAEKRASIINHAVTKGLDPDVEMKDSGVEWVGQIPVHWEIVKMSYVADVVDPNPSHRNPVYVEDGFPFISTVEFTDDDGVETDTPRRVAESTVIEQERRCRFRKGSVAFSRKGTIGAVRILPSELRFALLDSVCVVNCGKRLNERFLLHQLRSPSQRWQMALETKGAALPQMSVGKVRELRLLLPALSEQNEIVSALDAKLKSFSCAEHGLKSQIERLREYRQALITAAVTGKIDVEAEATP